MAQCRGSLGQDGYGCCAFIFSFSARHSWTQWSALLFHHCSVMGADSSQLGPRCNPPDMTLQSVPGATAEWQSISTSLAALAQRDQDLEAERRELQRMLREREREQEVVRLNAAYMAGQLQQYRANNSAAAVEQSLAAARSRGILGGVSGPTTPGDYATA